MSVHEAILIGNRRNQRYVDYKYVFKGSQSTKMGQGKSLAMDTVALTHC